MPAGSADLCVIQSLGDLLVLSVFGLVAFVAGPPSEIAASRKGRRDPRLPRRAFIGFVSAHLPHFEDSAE